MGMVIKSRIARHSCISSSLCHWIWLVSVLNIPIPTRVHVSTVLFCFLSDDFRCSIIDGAANTVIAIPPYEVEVNATPLFKLMIMH